MEAIARSMYGCSAASIWACVVEFTVVPAAMAPDSTALVLVAVEMAAVVAVVVSIVRPVLLGSEPVVTLTRVDPVPLKQTWLTTTTLVVVTLSVTDLTAAWLTGGMP